MESEHTGLDTWELLPETAEPNESFETKQLRNFIKGIGPQASEGVPFDDLVRSVEKARASGCGTRASAAPNKLIKPRMEPLMELVGVIASFNDVSGSYGRDGFVNPGLVFTANAEGGLYDDMSDEEYSQALNATEEFAVLWEGERARDGVHLACNALLYAVFNDPALFNRAYYKAMERLQYYRNQSKASSGEFVG
jgi:hypothetical protein